MIAVTEHDDAPTPPRPGPLIGADGSYTGTGQTLAFILGVLSLPLFPLAVTGALLYTNAEDRFGTDPDRARRLVIWSWIAIVTTPLLLIVGGAVAALMTA